MSMPKGKHQGGQTQGFPQRYPHTSFVSRSTTPQQRPDVSFHVAATAFPPQQGGGAAPPGGPQLRGLHHPHHGANPPIPPTHQQQPPPPSQSQHTGGPPGPAPTSTPPGPAEMGKQGPPHLQGQPQMPQGGQMQLSFGVPNQTRPNTSQPYFGGPRGPTPRMPNHRGQVVNMPANNVGQQIFSSHVPIQQMSMYPGVVPTPINPNQMFVQTSQMPMFSTQSRHQGAGTNYFPPAGQQQIMMHQQHQIYQPGFQPGPGPGQTQFYFSGVRNTSMAGAPGGVGPGLTAGASQPVVVPGAPSQMGQTGQVSMMPIASGNVMGVPGLAGESGTPSGPVSSSSSTGNKNTRRKYALDIIDPKTMVKVEVYEPSRSSTPPRSGESSARETPQPSAGPGQMDVAAEFAARVAKAASEKSSGPSASQTPFSESTGSSTQSVNINGPEVSMNSVASSEGVLNESDISNSKPQIGLDETMSSWKQTQPKASSIGNKINSNSKSSKVEGSLGKGEDRGNLSLETDNLVKQEIDRDRSAVPLGVPSVSAKEVTASQPDLPLSLVSQPVNPVGVVPVKEHSPGVLAVDSNLTPVVSAITNSPDVEVVHHRPGNRDRDQYAGLKSSTPAHPSPRRKQQRPSETSSVEKVTSSQSMPVMTNIPNVSSVTQVSSASGMVASHSVDSKPQREPPSVNAESKISPSLPAVTKKTNSGSDQPGQVVEDNVFVTLAPKERRDEKPSRGRERSSHNKECTDKSREKSQGSDREKIQKSRVRDNSTSGSMVANSPTPMPPSEPVLRGTAKTTAQAPLDDASSKYQANGETADPSEGKANQRGKHKRGQQKKELNRKGAEKEGTEMDAFAETTAPTVPVIIENAAAASNPSITPVPSVPAALPTAPVRAASPVPPATPIPVIAPTVPASSTSASSTPTTSNSVATSSPVTAVTVTVSNPVASIPAVIMSSIPSNPVLTNSNKMVDNNDIKNDLTREDKQENEELLVAARNEENTKVSAAMSDKPSLIEQTTGKSVAASKHTYKEDQWSPLNQDGKKKYERDFLISLKNGPLSKNKPTNLPDLEIVLKDPRPQRTMDIVRGPHDTFTPKFLSNQGPSSRGGVPPKRGSQQGKAKGGKPQGVIHVTLSLKEEVKLRESENAWKPGRMKGSENTTVTTEEESAKTEDLYKKVRGVLNKLTPQKFGTLVEQVRTLPIDTKEKLQGVINLVFDKATDEPGFSVAYAQMCKTLSNIHVTIDKDETQEQVNFRKLIVNRCQQEFEKNTEAELNKEQRLNAIANTKDPEKKKELQLQFDDECRKLRMKSVGNIRFIGELFKLHMLTTNIMQRCIQHLLSDGDEESLECLCKLLTTIGRDLEVLKQDLSPYFEKLKQIIQKRGGISSRVRFMLQDVIELRQNNWVPRRDDGNPKTIDQINKEAVKEAVEKEAMNSGPSSGSRYKNEDRGGDRKKSRGPNEDGWLSVRSSKNYPVDTTRLKPKVLETDTLILGVRTNYVNWNANVKAADTNKKGGSPVYSSNSFAALSEMPCEEKRGSGLSSGSRSGGNKMAPPSAVEKERMLAGLKSAVSEEMRPHHSHLQQSRSSSRDNTPRGGGDDDHRGPSVSIRLGPNSSNDEMLRGASPDTSDMSCTSEEEEVKKKTIALIDEYINNSNEKETTQLVAVTFGDTNINAFVLQCINYVLEKSSLARQNVGKLMCHLMKENVVPKPVFFSSFQLVIKDGDDLAIDIPKIWLYLAEIIVPSLSKEIITFAEFHTLGKLIAEILQLLVQDKGPGWIRERWDAAGLTWTDFVRPEDVDSFVKKHKLEFTVGTGVSTQVPSGTLTMDEVQKKLVQFLKPEQGTAHSFDQICDWIGANVGNRVEEPQFIRALMTALCESAVSQSSNSFKLKEEVLAQHNKFFQKYIDNKEERELQCLYAVQAFVHKLEHPQGLICSIFHVLWENNFISSESFSTWESSKDACAQVGRGVALKSLTTFFTALREGEDESEES